MVATTRKLSGSATAAKRSGVNHRKGVPRNVITRDEAREIYLMQEEYAGTSDVVGEMYGIAPKTVRDIWNRRTWVRATKPVWSQCRPPAAARPKQSTVAAAARAAAPGCGPAPTMQQEEARAASPTLLQPQHMNMSLLPECPDFPFEPRTREPLPWPCFEVMSSSYVMVPAAAFYSLPLEFLQPHSNTREESDDGSSFIQ